jgi:hypothetical protein
MVEQLNAKADLERNLGRLVLTTQSRQSLNIAEVSQVLGYVLLFVHRKLLGHVTFHRVYSDRLSRGRLTRNLIDGASIKIRRRHTTERKCRRRDVGNISIAEVTAYRSAAA